MKNTYIILGVIIFLTIVGGFVYSKKTLNSNQIISTPIFTPTPSLTHAEEIEELIQIKPEVIYPGDPVFITIISSSTPIKTTWGNKELKIFNYKNIPRVFSAVDFNDKSEVYELKITFENGKTISKNIKITPREKIERPLGIPEKFGGNTSESAKKLVENLAVENAILNTVKSATTTLWSEAFGFPLENIFITDNYGYDRKTVTQTIAHKGTDFRAVIGTPVKAMNKGEVRVARKFTVYGNTVIVDHGQKVQTLYMHLSRLDVKEGDVVEPGDQLGLSGDTGYVDAAHLHVSVKIDALSIDPMTFLHFFVD